MKKFAIGLFILFSLVGSVAFATFHNGDEGKPPIQVSTISSNVFNEDAQRGCCSWHGGVSHCGPNGYYICNDGTQSPSCRCN